MTGETLSFHIAQTQLEGRSALSVAFTLSFVEEKRCGSFSLLRHRDTVAQQTTHWAPSFKSTLDVVESRDNLDSTVFYSI